MKTADVVIPEHRHRMLDPSAARSLMESIREVGLLNPIVVQRDGTLVAGLHRHAACEMLGWTEIPATVVDLDVLRAELAELDENLEHSPLTVLQRSEHLARRKEIYESLHPETKVGAASGAAGGGKKAKDPESGSFVPVPAFIDDTAQRTGRSRTVIAEEVKIARDLPRDVRDAVRGTPTANNKSALRTLADLPPDQQREVVAAGPEAIAAAAKVKRTKKAQECVVKPTDAEAPEESTKVQSKSAAHGVPAGKSEIPMLDPFERFVMTVRSLLEDDLSDPRLRAELRVALQDLDSARQ